MTGFLPTSTVPMPWVPMGSALDHSVHLVAYLALFAGVGFVFVFANLLIGYFLRPRNPSEEKLEIYECGEPTIGSSFVQFDLRFYVIALIFIVFDVEVAFLFPFATAFGKAAYLADSQTPLVTAPVAGQAISGEAAAPTLTPYAEGVLRELGIADVATAVGSDPETVVREGATALLGLAAAEVLVFFMILLVGFAYEWKTGALDWVRALTAEFREKAAGGQTKARSDAEPVVSA